MITHRSKELLAKAHEQIETAWAEVCEAERSLIKAQARKRLATEKYSTALKNWDATVKSCTPGKGEGV